MLCTSLIYFISHRSGCNNIARKNFPLISLAIINCIGSMYLNDVGFVSSFIHVHQSRV